ncbi:cell division protein ZapA [Acuticoccus mangrovi]
MDGHDYRMACEPGEEERVVALAEELDGTIAVLKGRIGEIGDRRLAVMAALTVLDRLHAAEARNAELTARIARLERAREQAALAAEGEDEPLIARIDRVTDAVDRLVHIVSASVRAMDVDAEEEVAPTFARARAPEGRPDNAEPPAAGVGPPAADGESAADPAPADPAFASRTAG